MAVARRRAVGVGDAVGVGCGSAVGDGSGVDVETGVGVGVTSAIGPIGLVVGPPGLLGSFVDACSGTLTRTLGDNTPAFLSLP